MIGHAHGRGAWAVSSDEPGPGVTRPVDERPASVGNTPNFLTFAQS
jgi:hypothetical protein